MYIYIYVCISAPLKGGRRHQGVSPFYMLIGAAALAKMEGRGLLILGAHTNTGQTFTVNIIAMLKNWQHDRFTKYPIEPQQLRIDMERTRRKTADNPDHESGTMKKHKNSSKI